MPSHQQNKPENVGGFNPSSSLAASSEVSYPNPAFPWVSAAALKQQSFGALNGGPETRFQSQWHQQSMPAGSGSVYVAFPPWHFGGGGQGQTQNQALDSAFNFIRSGTTAGRSTLPKLLAPTVSKSISTPPPTPLPSNV